MTSLTAEQLKTLAIGSTNYRQNQSLSAKDLLEFFRRESDEKTIPTQPEDSALNFYNKTFLETGQYVCLEDDNSIGAFWSWLWIDKPEDGLKLRSSWDIPLQSKNHDVLWLAPICISKQYRGLTHWWPLLKNMLPKHKTLAGEQGNNRLIILNNLT